MKIIVIGLVLSLLNFGPLFSQDCNMDLKQFKVQGNSMTGIVENGDYVFISIGYYTCNIVKRGHVAMVKWAGNETPLLKRVVLLPGDRIHLVAKGKNNVLMVNGDTLRTSQNKPYNLNEKACAMIRLYIDSYSKIPNASFLVMGNRPKGSMDATKFGYVGLDALIGKLIDSH